MLYIFILYFLLCICCVQRIERFPQGLSSDIILSALPRADKAVFLVKPPCTAVFLQHPEYDPLKALLREFADAAVKKCAAKAFADIFRQKVYRNDLAAVLVLFPA